MEAIILAGGLGTRLKGEIDDIPKPMASVQSKPFLSYILDDLIAKGVTRIILSVGYKWDVIKNFFSDNYKGISIEYIVEEAPLGTGGAIKKAIGVLKSDSFLLVNGDTFFDVDLGELNRVFLDKDSDLLIALKYIENADRYGIVEIDDRQNIVRFQEKKNNSSGLINGGIYFIKKAIFEDIQLDIFSFEKEILCDFNRKIKRIGVIQNGYFIDIGIPEDYRKAQIDFKDCDL